MSRDPSFFLAGNIGYHNADPLQDAWDTMMHLTSDTWGYIDNVVTQVPHEFRRFVRRTMAHPIDRDNALTLDSLLLANGGVGTSRRLSEQGQWVHNRDVIDARVIDDYNNGTGDELVSSVDMTGGWPYYENGEYHYIAEAEFIAHPEQYPLQSGTAYADNDHDGMADVWEEMHALDPDDASDGNLTNLSPAGYTNLEVFLGGE